MLNNNQLNKLNDILSNVNSSNVEIDNRREDTLIVSFTNSQTGMKYNLFHSTFCRALNKIERVNSFKFPEERRNISFNTFINNLKKVI